MPLHFQADNESSPVCYAAAVLTAMMKPFENRNHIVVVTLKKVPPFHPAGLVFYVSRCCVIVSCRKRCFLLYESAFLSLSHVHCIYCYN